MRDLVLFVPVPKTGSLTLRAVLRAAAAASGNRSSWLCDATAPHAPACAPGTEVVLGAVHLYGTGAAHRAPSGWRAAAAQAVETVIFVA